MPISTLPGGPADKSGLLHEAMWGVRGMVAVLNSEAESMRIEEPRMDGTEFHLQRDGCREHWQAKRQVVGQKTWTLRLLESEGVLGFFHERFLAGERCVFASVSAAPELRMLAENAAAAQSFPEFRDQFLSDQRRAHFGELRRILGSPPEEEVFGFLRAVRVEGATETTLEALVGCALGATFHGPWRTTLSVLRDLYLQSIHETFAAADLERHLEKCGIPRRVGSLPDTRDRILAVTRSYVAGQRAKLIRGESIPRSVAADVVSRISGSADSLDFLITSGAGGGKSACLCQIVEALQAANVPVLAFRLDSVEPVASPILVGEQLGLAESPAIALASAFPGQCVVLVVDQLDFVSTTSGRHPDFFDTLGALRDEVFGLRQRHTIHLVLACRRFDLDHDHRFRSLTAKDQPPVEVGNLTAEEVMCVIAREGGDAARWSPAQLELLRVPQNLWLFVGAGLSHRESVFTSQKELFDAYWDTKRSAVAARRPAESNNWLRVIERIASEMSARQQLSLPKTALDEFPPGYLACLVSEGVLTFDSRRFGFGHETFFDYCFVRTLPQGGREFVGDLESDAQHLFRRAQLRQVLTFLRDDDPPAYLAAIDAVLRSERIRPHLKLLTIELVAAQSNPRDEELAALIPWIDSEMECRRAGRPNPDKLATRIWDAFFASRTLFGVADRTGLLHQWLHSSESWLEDAMTSYLRWQTERHADRVAELLEPFVAQGGEWKARLRFMMEWGNLEKGRRYFDLFLRLLDDGSLDEARDRFASNGTFWSMLHGLAEAKPGWCAELAAHWLDRKVAIVRTALDETQSMWSLLQDEFGVDDLFKSASGDPLAFLTQVLPSILRAAEAFAYEDESGLRHDRVWPIHLRGEHMGLSQSYPAACETAFERIGKTAPDNLRPFIAQLRAARLHTANHLLMRAYLSAPEHFAEEALSLLAEEPERLECGFADTPYWLSRVVIEKSSAHCSETTFRKVEFALLGYVPDREKSKDGHCWRGHAAYNLATALRVERRSSMARTQIAEWEIKFKEPARPPREMRVYSVESPIKPNAAELMTDEQWLRAIEKYDTERGTYDFDHPERGGAWSLAAMMRSFVEKQPERFARLALRFPADTEPSYWMNVLYGLKGVDISAAQKVEVAKRVFEFDDTACLRAALDLLGAISDAPLPTDALEFIRRMAVEHPDPPGDEGATDEIPTPGMNFVRGHAVETIRELVWGDARQLDFFADAIERAVHDRNLSVRASAASTLIAVARHDFPRAFRWMESLIATDDRILASTYLLQFIRRGLREHFGGFRPIIDRMLHSSHAAVRREGGVLACLARLYHKNANDLAEYALRSDTACRMGACAVAKDNLLHADCRAWCEAVLPRLFDDPEKEVRSKAAHCFWHLWQAPETSLTTYDPLIRVFLASPAFADEPTYLLHALQETKQRLPETALDVCDTFITRCAEEARDIRTAMSADEHTVGKLVFSAYAQMQCSTLQLRALHLIDRMCLEGLHSAGRHLGDFER